jgi:hypothetical protein
MTKLLIVALRWIIENSFEKWIMNIVILEKGKFSEEKKLAGKKFICKVLWRFQIGRKENPLEEKLL